VIIGETTGHDHRKKNPVALEYTTHVWYYTAMEIMILVDEHDNPIGTMEKMEAHRRGLLHRAFSCFVFNDRRETLIQRRAANKYHNPGIWANTCCSHPRPGENIIEAVKRRMPEELGFAIANPRELMWFIYKAEFPNGLTEHELDHVVIAEYNGESIKQNPDEVAEIRWISRKDLEAEVAANPENFSFWLKRILELNVLPW